MLHDMSLTVSFINNKTNIGSENEQDLEDTGLNIIYVSEVCPLLTQFFVVFLRIITF